MADLSKIKIPNGTEYNLKDAQARADITALNGSLENVFNDTLPVVSWVADYYIDTSGATVDIENPTLSSSGYRYGILPAHEGDVFVLNCIGGSSPRAWCFISASGQRLSVSASNTTCSGAEVTAPANSAYIVINDNSGTSEKSYQKIPILLSMGKLESVDLALKTPKGYNIIGEGIDGVGGYYYSSGKINFNATYTTYHYVIVPVKKNTTYVSSRGCRWWILTKADGTVLSYGASTKRIFETGEAEKLYITYANADWNLGATVYEGEYGTYESILKPDFVGGFNALGLAHRYGCALPKRTLRGTVGYPYKIYKDSAVALPLFQMFLSGRESSKDAEGNVNFACTASGSTTNAYNYSVYDTNYACVERVKSYGGETKTLNLSDCTVLVIGDSTVARDSGAMTQVMLDEFTAAGHTLTLIGTRGTSPNLHEGRSGARASEYVSSATAGGVTNAFYNPTSKEFDFSYYMTENGFSTPDFVVLQLGINDLYNVGFENDETAISTLVSNIKTIIDSILEYNSDIKILLNLPTVPNSNQSVHSNARWAYNNIRIRYCMAMQWELLKNYTSSARETYNHLILDASTDIADNVHPASSGFSKMGKEVVSQINFWQNE